MSNLSLERLLFDPNNIADGPKVGSYVVSASGRVIDDAQYGGTGPYGLYVNVINPIAIDLTQDDEVTVFQGTDPWVISGAVTCSQTTSPWVISGAVTCSQTTSPWVISGAVTTDNPLPNVAFKSTATSMADVAAPIPATALAARKRIQVQNLGNEDVYVGGSVVTTGDGLKISKGGTESIECGPTAILYGICASGKTSTLHVLEWS
jgi:hypothetical protein